ncbi:MAG: hypothetical protein AB7P76_10740 [Candidatus Melainabacteria bacterium]
MPGVTLGYNRGMKMDQKHFAIRARKTLFGFGTVVLIVAGLVLAIFLMWILFLELLLPGFNIH